MNPAIRQTATTALALLLFASPCTAERYVAVDSLEKRAHASLKLQWAAWPKISFRYTFRMSGLQRECLYARSQSKFYHAAIDLFANGSGYAHPNEISWDGAVTRSRQDLESMTIAPDRDAASISCPTPMQAVLELLEGVIDPLAPQQKAFRFHSSRSEGRDIFLVYELGGGAQTIEYRLAADRAYWPIEIRTKDRAGNKVMETTEISYTELKAGGNRVFIPTVYRASYFLGSREEKLEAVIDPNSIQTNGEAIESLIQFAPFPCQSVVDLKANRTVPATDPTWIQSETMRFPFKHVAEFREKNGPIQSRPKLKINEVAIAKPEIKHGIASVSWLATASILVGIALGVWGLYAKLRRPAQT